MHSSEESTIIFLLLLAFIGFLYLVATKSKIIGSWSHLFENMEQDPDTFYGLIQDYLAEHQVPDFKAKTVTLHETGMLSHHRLYLQISRGNYVFHICAAPWGTDFFFSWWLRHRMSNYERLTSGKTEEAYYKMDTDTMFRTSVQQAVSVAIDQVTKEKGKRGLTELERQPDLRYMLSK